MINNNFFEFKWKNILTLASLFISIGRRLQLMEAIGFSHKIYCSVLVSL